MNHSQRVELIRSGVAGKLWADFGAGSGAFTLALTEILGRTGEVYAVDKKWPIAVHPQITPIRADFTQKLDLPLLDGILLANSLHYVRGQEQFLKSLHAYLKPNGRILIVEYQNRLPNPWVPYPVSYEKLAEVAQDAGYSAQKMGTQPSDFGGSIYAALLTNPTASHPEKTRP